MDKLQERNAPDDDAPIPGNEETSRARPRFEVYGEEMLEKRVKRCGNSGRIYLPPEWVGKSIKVIRYD